MRSMNLLAACLVLGACACRATSFPSSSRDPSCTLEADHGIKATGLQCITGAAARVRGLAAPAGGPVIAVGTFSGLLEAGSSRAASQETTSFVALLPQELGSATLVGLELPGAPGGWHADALGATMLTSSTEPPEGPFLTRIDRSGAIVARRDLGFGGLVTSVAGEPSGQLLLRVKADGVRLVRLAADGRVVQELPRLTPSWTHELATSIEENGFVQEVVALSDGSIVLVHARPLTGEPDEPQEMLTRVAPDGRVLWQKAVRLGRGVQLAAMGAHVVALCPKPLGVCRGLAPEGGFGVTRFDLQGNPVWGQCFAARTTGLRLAAAPRGQAVIAGQFTGQANLGGRTHEAGTELRSFILWLDEAGSSRDSVALGETGSFVAVQALAVRDDGRVHVAGALGRAPASERSRDFKQTHVFIASMESDP